MHKFLCLFIFVYVYLFVYFVIYFMYMLTNNLAFCICENSVPLVRTERESHGFLSYIVENSTKIARTWLFFIVNISF